jgi:hypothetical protein
VQAEKSRVGERAHRMRRPDCISIDLVGSRQNVKAYDVLERRTQFTDRVEQSYPLI